MRRPTARWCPQVPGDVALVFAVGLADLAAAQTKPQGLRGHVPFCKTTPREHMTGPRCFFACDPDESSIKPFLDVMGEDRLICASGYPHWDAKFPGTVDTIADRTELHRRAEGQGPRDEREAAVHAPRVRDGA